MTGLPPAASAPLPGWARECARWHSVLAVLLLLSLGLPALPAPWRPWFGAALYAAYPPCVFRLALALRRGPGRWSALALLPGGNVAAALWLLDEARRRFAQAGLPVGWFDGLRQS